MARILHYAWVSGSLSLLFASVGCLSGGSASPLPTLADVSQLSVKIPARFASFSPQAGRTAAQTSTADESTTGGPAAKPRYVARPLIDNILFGPRRSAEHGTWTLPPNTEDVRFSSADGTRLHGWLTRVRQPRHVILFTHGNGGNVAYCGGILRVISERFQATCLAFDYRGYGRSQGQPTLEGVVADASAARAFLAKTAGVPPERVILWGHSMGGAIAIQLTQELAPQALILDSTFSSLRDEAAHISPNLAWMVSRKLWNSADVISSYTGPLFIMHGDADRVIPWTQGRALFEAASEPKQFLKLPGGQHNTSLRHPDALQPLTDFLRRSQSGNANTTP
ncbi:MAG: alpha/beta hydrolase [Planctomycetaceae bacterium]|nr:alpha/beta hydrolase [Planctomycetaceae bacterium]